MIDRYSSDPRDSKSMDNITDEKTICGIRYVLVTWKNMPAFTSSWEQLDILRREPKYQSILNAKGLLFDEHMSKEAKRSSYNTPPAKTDSKHTSNESTTKAIKSKKKAATSMKVATVSPPELLLDEDSTSINDCRGVHENCKEGFQSPMKKTNKIIFTPYVTSKNRLTCNFYRDLVEYYKKSVGDNPPSPIVLQKRKPLVNECIRMEVTGVVSHKMTGRLKSPVDSLIPVGSLGAKIEGSLDNKEVIAKVTSNHKIEIVTKIDNNRAKNLFSSKAEPTKYSETNLILSKLQKIAKTTPGCSSTLKIKYPDFKEMLSLAKDKLENRESVRDNAIMNIFGKFEDRKGIANDNEVEYKNNPLTKVAIKNITVVENKTPVLQPTSPNQPPYPNYHRHFVNPSPVAHPSGTFFIPNQPTLSLAGTIKKVFPSH